MGVIDSANITKIVVAQFEPSKLLEVAEFLSQTEIKTGLNELHDQLKPVYEANIVAYYKTLVDEPSLDASHVQQQVTTCMAQGLKAVYQHKAFSAINLVHDGVDSGSAKIQKTRTWQEISSE